MSEPHQQAAAPEAAAAIAPAKVGTGTLRQHVVGWLEDGQVLLLAGALGPPRLWDYLMTGALDGFREGYERPHDGRASTRLHQGMLVAQQALRRRVDGLIERRMSDVALLAVTIEGATLHVVSAGPLRAYLYQQHALRRLGTDDVPDEGLLKAAPTWSAEPLQPGDLVLAGSPSACTEATLAQLTAALDAGQPLSAQQIAELLSAPALAAGESAAALALRLPVS